MVAMQGDMTKGTFLITNTIVWAISKFEHILTHLERQSGRPVQQSARGGKINILNKKKHFLRSTDFKLLRRTKKKVNKCYLSS